MGVTYVKEVMSPEQLLSEYPLPEEHRKLKIEWDKEIARVFTGKSDKFLVIIGPCSADNEDSVCDYINRLVKVQEKVNDKIIIIPRIYTNKPRTTGEGYKGIVHQPDPEKAPDLLEGLIAICLRQTKCFIQKTGHMYQISCPMLQSARVPWKTSSTGLPSAESISRAA